MPIALVTGAARGIGLAIMQRLSDDGFSVVAVDVDSDEVSRSAARFGAQPAALDVTDRRAVESLAASLDECSVLVNNAATWRYTPLASTSAEEARLVLDVNVVGPLTMMQCLLPLLSVRGGSIVNLSSITAKYSPTGAGLYPASKAALEAITRVAAVEFGPHGVRCNAVGPGIIQTESALPHYGDEPTRERRGRALPAGRYGNPDDVADVVSFFCSDDSRYVTGQVVYVDGGYTAAGADFFRAARDVPRP